MERIQVTLTFRNSEEVAEFFKKRDFSEVKGVTRVTEVRGVAKVSHLDDTPPGGKRHRLKAYRKEAIEIVRTAGTAGCTPKEVELRLPDWALRMSKNPAYHMNQLSFLARKRRLRREVMPGTAPRKWRYWTAENWKEKVRSVKAKYVEETPVTPKKEPKKWTRNGADSASKAVREAALLVLDEAKHKGATKHEIMELVKPEIRKGINKQLPSIVLIGMAKSGTIVKVKDIIEGRRLRTGSINRYWLPQYATH